MKKKKKNIPKKKNSKKKILRMEETQREINNITLTHHILTNAMKIKGNRGVFSTL